MIGLSLRLALALGLHLRNEDPAVEESRKDTLVQTWWSLHSIECLLSTVTGRPPAIASDYCTVPLPYSSLGEHGKSQSTSERAPFGSEGDASPQARDRSNDSESNEHIPNIVHYRVSCIKISFIAQKALLQLYSPQTAAQSWKVCPLLSIFRYVV